MKKQSSLLRLIFYVFLTALLLSTILKGCLTMERFRPIPQYMNHPTKCFDCEQDIIRRYGTDYTWMAQPTKLFSAEAAGIAQKKDVSGGFLGKTVKYYE